MEDSAKKQNEYQERKLSKYLLGIEKEHEGNMTMLRQQEKELKRTERKLTRQLSRLNRQRADSAYLSLPTIALSEKALSGEEELPGQRGRKNLIKRKEASWYDDQASRDSVIIRLLNFPNKVEPDEPAEEEEQEMPLQNAASSPDKDQIKLPPLTTTSTENRKDG